MDILESSDGFQQMKKNYESIVEKIALDPRGVAVALHAKGFVSSETVSEVIELSATKKNKAMKLYVAASKEVEQYPHKYEAFLAITQETQKRNKRNKYFRWCFIVTVLISIFFLVYYNFDGIKHTFRVQRQSRTLPHPSKTFVGRESELQKLMKIIDFDSDEVRVLNIIGSPGFGKSTLAIHIGHKLIDQGVYVHYINMAEFESRNVQLVLAERILRSNKKIATFDKLLKWIENKDGDMILLILDNCDEVLHAQKDRLQKSILQVVQASVTVKVVMTSRQIALQIQYYHLYHISELSSTAAVSLLDQKFSRTRTMIPSEAKEAIADLTGNVPLALHIIGSLLLLPDPPTPIAVIKELKQNPVDFLSPQELPREHRLNVSINLSYKYLEKSQQIAGYVLALFPGSFTKETVIGVFDKYNQKVMLIDDWLSETILKTLLHRSLLEYNERSKRYQYHRLIKEFFFTKQQKVGRKVIKSRFKLAFRHYFLKKLYQNTLTFKIKYIDSLQFLDDEKHNVYALLHDLKKPRIIPKYSFLLTLNSITLALEYGYLPCRFTSTELRLYLNESVIYLNEHIINFVAQAGNKKLFNLDGKRQALKVYYQQIYVQLVVVYADLLSKIEGKESASEFMENISWIVDSLSRKAQTVTKGSDLSNTWLTPGSHTLSPMSRHRSFYRKLGDHYLALSQHSDVIRCHLKIIESAQKCKQEKCSYKEIAYMYKTTGNYKEVAQFLELSLQKDHNNEISKAEILLELLSIYKYLNAKSMPWSENENEQKTLTHLVDVCYHIALKSYTDDQALFKNWKIIIDSITTLTQAGEDVTLLEERLFDALSTPTIEYQLQPENAINFLEVVKESHTKTIKWGSILLKPFEGYHNLSITEQYEVLELYLKVSLAKFKIGNYSEALDGIEYVHKQIVRHSQTLYTQPPNFKELYKTTCFYMFLRIKYVYSCYQESFVDLAKGVVKQSLYDFPLKFPRHIVYLIFAIPFGFSRENKAKMHYSTRAQSETVVSAKTDIIAEPINGIQFLTDTIGLELEYISHTWYLLLPYLLEIINSHLFLIIINVVTVYVRLWIFFTIIFTILGFTFIHISEHLNSLVKVLYIFTLNDTTSHTVALYRIIFLSNLYTFIITVLAKVLQNPWGYIWLGIYVEGYHNNLAGVHPFQPIYYYQPYQMSGSYRGFFRNYGIKVIKTINYLIYSHYCLFLFVRLSAVSFFISIPFLWFVFYNIGVIS